MGERSGKYPESASEMSWDLSFSEESTGCGIERCLSCLDNLEILIEAALLACRDITLAGENNSSLNRLVGGDIDILLMKRSGGEVESKCINRVLTNPLRTEGIEEEGE